MRGESRKLTSPKLTSTFLENYQRKKQMKAGKIRDNCELNG